MAMEINPENAFRILRLPPSQLKAYLPKIFSRLAVPAEQDGIFVETYVGQLDSYFVEQVQKGEGAGWSALQIACVECSFFETFISLVQHPRDDIETAIHDAWDCLTWLCFVANHAQRKILLEKAIALDTLNLCLKWMKHGKLCLHRHGGARILRSLCQELYIGHTLAPPETANLLHTLFRYVLEETDTYSDELRDPDKGWQVEVMTDKFSPQPGAASKYGKRWFGLVQEYCLFAAHSLLCCIPQRSTQYRSELLKAKPEIIQLAFDCARLPRPEWYPETQIDQLSMEICASLFQLPLRFVPGLTVPQDNFVREEYEEEWESAVSSLGKFGLRQAIIPNLMAAWKRLDDESYTNLYRSLSKVQSEWFGMKLSSDQIGDMYEMRGSSRVAMLQLMTAVTHSPLCQNHDIIPLLRIAYLSTKQHTPLSADSFKPPGSIMLYEQKSLEWHEGIVYTFRMPLDIPTPSNDRDDAPLQMPAAAVAAPCLLLRILTLLAERGQLDEIQEWEALPPGCAVDTDLGQVKQITSPAVIGKLLPLVAKRVTKHRESTRTAVADGFLYMARSKYRQAAELAAAMIAFDKATKGRWAEDVKGMWNELVICLGNAAEMSIRHGEYKTGLGYAVAAGEAAHAAPGNAGISPETIAKNERRSDTARSKLSSQT